MLLTGARAAQALASAVAVVVAVEAEGEPDEGGEAADVSMLTPRTTVDLKLMRAATALIRAPHLPHFPPAASPTATVPDSRLHHVGWGVVRCRRHDDRFKTGRRVKTKRRDFLIFENGFL